MTGPSSRSSGVGFLGALLLAFIVLKLTGVIGWSWWLVLAPAWISAAVAAFLGVFIVAAQLGIRYYDRQAEAQQRARIAWRAATAAGVPRAYEHGPRQRWGVRPPPVYGNCPVHDTVHEMLKYGRMCDGWEPADPEPVDR